MHAHQDGAYDAEAHTQMQAPAHTCTAAQHSPAHILRLHLETGPPMAVM